MYKYIQKKNYATDIVIQSTRVFDGQYLTIVVWSLGGFYFSSMWALDVASVLHFRSVVKPIPKLANENKLNQRKPAQGREKEISLTMAKAILVLQLISSKGGTNFLHQ